MACTRAAGPALQEKKCTGAVVFKGRRFEIRGERPTLAPPLAQEFGTVESSV
jgi:hypothetical protein